MKRTKMKIMTKMMKRKTASVRRRLADASPGSRVVVASRGELVGVDGDLL